MDIYEFDVLNCISKEGYTNQRLIADITNYSLGRVNEAIQRLVEGDFLNDRLFLTDKAHKEIAKRKPKNAIILAAGFGMRMTPINNEVPKGLLEVHGQPLIERIIYQLHEVGIFDIDIVVGFLKEKYEYLIDKYGVNLVYNKDYATKNNIHSLNLVINKVSNSYIIPSDIWADRNPFSNQELYSWYSVSDVIDDDSTIRVNRQRKLISDLEGKTGNTMIGISYLLEDEARIVRKRVTDLCKDSNYDDSFWEDSLFDDEDNMIIYARVYKSDEVVEINTYEQLREMDEDSSHLNSDILSLIGKELEVDLRDIVDITVQKKGMTNRSFRFRVGEEQYIMRVPGEGTDKLIDRQNEYRVYQAIKDINISDNVLYMSKEKGYKITRFWDTARVCDPFDKDDVKSCMEKLREFHNSNLEVSHTFDIFERLEFYESLWEGKPSIFKDYLETKEKVYKLKEIVEPLPKEWKLAHIDAVPDNFLFVDDKVYLIDWEYAGMQDSHVDIAMFAIYSMYDREHVDALIDSYFTEGCTEEIRMKIYCYIAICGLLWSNWCEYKRFYGVEFGEYSLKQYRYAKEYYSIVMNEFMDNR